MTEIKEDLPINVHQPWLRVLADRNLTLSNVVPAHRYTKYLLSDRVQAECGCCVDLHLPCGTCFQASLPPPRPHPSYSLLLF